MPKKRIDVRLLINRARDIDSSQPLPAKAKRIFALSFISELILIYPFYVIMFGERGNVSAAGIGILLASWMIVSLAAEVPTGVIADKMSKKWSLVIGRIMQLTAFSLWTLIPNFGGYLSGFIVWGIGDAFISGAYQAYIYESFADEDKSVFGKVYTRSSAFMMLAYTLGSLAAFLIGPDYSVLLILSVVVSAISLGITISLPSTKSQVLVEVEPNLQTRVLASALTSIRKNLPLRRILFGAVLIQGLIWMLAEYMPAYYQQVGIPTDKVALFMSISSGLAVLLYWWMHHAEVLLTKYQVPIIVTFTLLFIISFAGGAYIATLGLLLLTRVLRVLSVNNEAQIQRHAPNESRATVGSMYSFTNKLLSAVLVSSVGFFAVGNKIVTPLRYSVLIVVAILLFGSISFSAQQKKS